MAWKTFFILWTWRPIFHWFALFTFVFFHAMLVSLACKIRAGKTGYSARIGLGLYWVRSNRPGLKTGLNLVVQARPALGHSAPGSGFNIVFFRAGPVGSDWIVLELYRADQKDPDWKQTQIYVFKSSIFSGGPIYVKWTLIYVKWTLLRVLPLNEKLGVKI